MTLEQQLIQQILQFIRSDAPQKDPIVEDIAEQYADLCDAINQRLHKCDEFLNKGMRSEAVHEAAVPPDLLELVDTVNFRDAVKWRNFCEDLGLPMFQPLHLEIVDRLREEMATEENMAPLLKEYRRLVYQGERNGCIDLLRQIRARDPENPVWAENLRPLEEEQLVDLVYRAKQALADEDLERLRELNAELTHAQRVIPAPADLLDKIGEALGAEHKREVGALGDTLAASLKKAHDAMDVEQVRTLLGRWDELAEDNAFQPTPEAQGMVAPARDWLAALEAQQQKEAEFQTAVAAMWDLLRDPGLDAITLEQRWHELSSRDHPIPSELRDKVTETRARLIQETKARRTRIVTAVVAVIVIAVALAAFFGWRAAANRKRQGVIDQLAALVDQQRYDEVNDALERLATTNPALFRAPEVAEIQTRTRDALAAQEQRRTELQAAMDTLDRIRRADYQASDEEVLAALDSARKLAEGDDNARELVNAWASAWDASKARGQQKIDTELKQLTSLIQKQLLDKASKSFATPHAELRAIREAQSWRQQGEALVGQGSAGVADAFKKASAALDTWETEANASSQALQQSKEQRTQLLQDLRVALPDLDAYGKLLEGFVNSFPRDENTNGFRRALQQLEPCRQAAALCDFTIAQWPPSADELTDLGRIAADSVWGADTATCGNYAASLDKLRAKLPSLALGSKEIANLQVIYYSPKGENAWRPLYHTQPIRSRAEEGPNGTYQVYWGDVYYYTNDDEKPWLQHTSKIFPNKLTTQFYDIRAKRIAQDNLTRHARFLMKTLAGGMGTKALDIYLLESIGELLKTDDMLLVPRAWMIKRFVHLLCEHFLGDIPELDEMRRLSNRMQTTAPWMNPKHPDTIAAEKEISIILPQFPSPAPVILRLQRTRQLLAEALSRRVKVAGSFQPNARGELEFVTVGPISSTAWILVADSTVARPHFNVVARDLGDGKPEVMESVKRDAFAGQIVFAPSDTETTSSILTRVYGDALPKNVAWPASWPANARR